MRNKKQWLHRTKQRKKNQQRTLESGFCNVNNGQFRLNALLILAGKKQHKKTKETNVHKKTTCQMEPVT